MDQINLNQNYVSLSAATTGTGVSGDFQNLNCKGLKVYINISAVSSCSLTVTVKGKDPVSGTYFTILASAALSSTGFTVLTIYPGMTAASNSVASDVLPSTYEISYSVSGTSISATISGCLIP